MPIFSQFGEIVWQRLFNIVRILQATALNWSKNDFGEIHISQGLDWLNELTALKVDDVTLTDDLEIAESINSYF